ncbi:MAG: enoyl-CoA hydratase/isomerase family protein [Deltaproteobacteria bacterium]|nr:enoyl-CoA hydratase/isomerase family protein [Deltaproteobacteria bacterium]MBW1923834.1 enoyl-CoA hydratase/isomerase family protein [Deltaproteobacteria bacterium]MBW1948551.1 enoyl-CoA hydratase/isomerase family protein [Deltaproteobacteria bacterium]MBW2006979.1 enoyl-CoA hydratase/isomerase family protein [Deltaproteobacteria bacterium]MBW2102305.1 enoyl-CoA hydratase/isomerase family protein [Deltaproteobacteria bacterium]
MDYETIRTETRGMVSILRLNRPERMNAVIEEMYLEIQDCIEKAGKNPDVRALILTGSVLERNGKVKQAFCAGADLKKHAGGERTHAQKRAYILMAHETTRQLYCFPKPIIAAVNGPARGAGAEMALSCDFIFMAEEATLAFPETGLGTFVGGGVTVHLPRLVGPAKAKELIYAGTVVDGRTAFQMGLAQRCVPVEDLLGEALAFAEVLAHKAPLSMAFAKQRLQQPPALDLDTVLHLEAEAILSCMDTEDWHEGIRAFQEKRKPVYKGR